MDGLLIGWVCHVLTKFQNVQGRLVQCKRYVCLEGAKIHDERDRNRGLHGAVRTLGGAAYYSRAAPRLPTKENTTGARAHAPSRSCRCAKALTETHPGVRDWLSATRICMQSKLGTA